MAEITTLAEADAELVVDGALQSDPGDHGLVRMWVHPDVTVMER